MCSWTFVILNQQTSSEEKDSDVHEHAVIKLFFRIYAFILLFSTKKNKKK